MWSRTGGTCHAAAVMRPGLAVQTVPGTTHFIPLEKPEVVRNALSGR